MAYPSYPVGFGSSVKAENNYKDDFSENGTMHSRLMSSRIYYRFNVIHHNLTGQEYADLMAVYEANFRGALTGFTYHDESPAQTYTVTFLEPPQIVDNLGSNRFNIGVSLRGYAA